MRSTIKGITGLSLVVASAFLVVGAAHASPARITGVEAGAFNDRELVVVRHEGGVSLSPRFSWNRDASTLTVQIRNATISQAIRLKPEQPIILGVELTPVSGKNEAVLKLTLSNDEIIERRNWRFGNYSRQIVLVELFPLKTKRDQAPKIRNLEEFWKQKAQPQARRSPLPPEQTLTVKVPASELDAALRAYGLYDPAARFTVISEGAGTISTPQGQRGLTEVFAEDAVNELVLIGGGEAIKGARKAVASLQSSISTEPQQGDNELSGSDPLAANGSFDADYPPISPGEPTSPASYQQLKKQLSDILVDLNAATGVNLWSTVMLLSRMSGVSIIIDPYAVDAPTGSRRQNLVEGPGTGAQGGGAGGFREAGQFNPESLQGSTNTVIGNFAQVPFDLALDIVLSTHNLSYLVFSTPDSDFTKPVILVSSKERIQQEIAGANKIDLYQEHYADPWELYNILDNLDLLPSREKGWYIYQNRYGGGYGGGGAGGGRGGRGGRGGAGGGGGGRAPGGGGGGIGPGTVFEGFVPTVPQSLLVETASANQESLLSELLSVTARYPKLRVLNIRFERETDSADRDALHRTLILCLK